MFQVSFDHLGSSMCRSLLYGVFARRLLVSAAAVVIVTGCDVLGDGTGGAGGSGGAGGTGGGGEAGEGGKDPNTPCDNTGVCQTCTQCAGQSACAAALDACQSNPSCVGIDQCISICGGDIECSNQCYIGNPEGTATFDGLVRCLYCDQCPDDCLGIANCS